MKKILAAIAVICMAIALSGCESLMDGHYSSVTPHPNPDPNSGQNTLQASNYQELLTIISRMMDLGKTSDIIYFSESDPTVTDSFMRIVSSQITTSHPIAVYTAAEITYDIGTNADRSTIAVSIHYTRNAAEMQLLQLATDIEEASIAIHNALLNFESTLLLRIYQYQNEDLVQLIEDYAHAYPQVCIETPQVIAQMYPNQGSDRVVVLHFSYQTNRDDLKTMQQAVQQIFDSARLYTTGNTGPWQVSSQLYAFLMERFDYTTQTSITPAYHLLQHGVGDYKAFARVYAAMCRQAGLNCQVVNGTKNGEPWQWNILLINGVYYHVDLLACNQIGSFRPYTAAQMTDYVWDYSAFPS